MNFSKKTWQHKFTASLSVRRIPFKVFGSMLSTEFGDIIFEAQRLSIKYAGQDGINAVYRYSDNPDIAAILKMLVNPPAVRKRTEEKKLKDRRIKWTWSVLTSIFVAGCSYAVTKLDIVPQFTEPKSLTGSSIPASPLLKRMSEWAVAIREGNIKDLIITSDKSELVQQMDVYARLSQPNKRISYTFDQGSWLYENLEHISRLSRHQIIYDTKTNFRINYKIEEKGRGSDIARKAFKAISDEFDGQLQLIQCKNTTIITDRVDTAALCS